MYSINLSNDLGTYGDRLLETIKAGGEGADRDRLRILSKSTFLVYFLVYFWV